MLPLYLLLIPMLGLAAYVVYQQRQLVRREEAAASRVRATLQTHITHVEAENTRLQQRLDDKTHDTIHNKALFSTLSNVASDMMFVLDADGKIVAHSASASQLFGDKNPVGQKLCELIDAPDLQDIVLRASNEEEGLEEQFKLDKRYFRARAQVTRFNDEQFFTGVAMQDITQLVRLNRARRDMVANISHELGTPVANIRIIIDSLFHDQSRPKRKASIASLRAIARETETLQWTVQELLDLSMIESGQAIMKLVDEPLHEIVDAAIERLDEKLDNKNLHVVRHVPAKMSVLCDRDHIKRVLVNLISNAIKWSPEDEAITISATKNGDEITVSVFDNGPGVPDDQRERIFERFYQVDTARSGREGSGLGLAISKHIVEAHGGKIWAEGNSQGGGGRFLFTLLKSNSNGDEEVYMDRGQHDALLNPYAAVIQSKNKEDVVPPDSLNDEDEIEFVEDDELED